MTEAVAALGAMAQETRLGIVRLLVREGPDGLPAGDIGEQIGIPPATLSFHLAQLGHAGLVRSRREGRRIIYSADFDGLQALMGFLMEKCCQPARGRGARKC